VLFAGLTLAKRSSPCLSLPYSLVSAGPEWLHEIKHDRLRVERDSDRVRLITRGSYDWRKRYPWIAEAALNNRIRQAVPQK